ncbi:unnamed protein product [Timema podura]|uniref:Uncharacterized protein n=1 Tax=Timema podura TaxID=61482 RepID=A0ABN7NN67_TIMPD|nr:unnamed protein product [Timema podura]
MVDVVECNDSSGLHAICHPQEEQTQMLIEVTTCRPFLETETSCVCVCLKIFVAEVHLERSSLQITDRSRKLHSFHATLLFNGVHAIPLHKLTIPVPISWRTPAVSHGDCYAPRHCPQGGVSPPQSPSAKRRRSGGQALLWGQLSTSLKRSLYPTNQLYLSDVLEQY